jgi:hypothetical protein
VYVLNKEYWGKNAFVQVSVERDRDRDGDGESEKASKGGDRSIKSCVTKHMSSSHYLISTHDSSTDTRDAHKQL